MNIRFTVLCAIGLLPCVGLSQSESEPPVEEVPDIGVVPLPHGRMVAPGHYLNVSTRVEVRNAGAAAALGFVVDESAVSLIRIVGPTLRRYEVSAAAEQPRAVLFHSGSSLGPLRKWKEHTALERETISAMSAAVGAFPLDDDSDDLVILLGTQKGQFTIEVSAEDEVGSVLIEIYRIPEEVLNQ